jgi:DNA-directed RNA polymerase specialized sigma54-like protein
MILELLEEQIELWEPEDAEVIRTIDSHEGTVERIIKVDVPAQPVQYFLYRYFTTQIAGYTTVVCSVDLNGVEADEVIQFLGERI